MQMGDSAQYVDRCSICELEPNTDRYRLLPKPSSPDHSQDTSQSLGEARRSLGLERRVTGLRPGVRAAILPIVMARPRPPQERGHRVLFLCTHNACRSQLAEGLLNARFPGLFTAESAGISPTEVNPLAIRVLAEWGIDISQHRSKSLVEFFDSDFEWIVTVCDDADRACPFFPGKGRRVHRAFADPSLVRGTEDERLLAFRRTRDEIDSWIKAFFAEAADSVSPPV